MQSNGRRSVDSGTRNAGLERMGCHHSEAAGCVQLGRALDTDSRFCAIRRVHRGRTLLHVRPCPEVSHRKNVPVRDKSLSSVLVSQAQRPHDDIGGAKLP